MYHHHHSVRRRVFIVEFCTGRLPQTRQFLLCVPAEGDLLQFLLASHIYGSMCIWLHAYTAPCIYGSMCIWCRTYTAPCIYGSAHIQCLMYTAPRVYGASCIRHHAYTVPHVYSASHIHRRGSKRERTSHLVKVSLPDICNILLMVKMHFQFKLKIF